MRGRRLLHALPLHQEMRVSVDASVTDPRGGQLYCTDIKKARRCEGFRPSRQQHRSNPRVRGYRGIAYFRLVATMLDGVRGRGRCSQWSSLPLAVRSAPASPRAFAWLRRRRRTTRCRSTRLAAPACGHEASAQPTKCPILREMFLCISSLMCIPQVRLWNLDRAVALRNAYKAAAVLLRAFARPHPCCNFNRIISDFSSCSGR